MPAYRSTDFDVHRNWLAITRHLPVKEWYYDNVNGTTVHTLDYPPMFAFWEYAISNNPLTQYLVDVNMLDERCLQLLPDTDNAPSIACVTFHRSTVIISDIVLWWGAWVVSTSGSVDGTTQIMQLSTFPTSFLLTVFHPGLLWLDHVHFQYNGILFGIFLASLGYLMQANNNSNSPDQRKYHTSHWKAAILFALLLTMKHLFLTLAPFYFVYLLRRYCLQKVPTTVSQQQQQEHNNKTSPPPPQLQPLHLVTLGMFTGITLLVPFLLFLKQMPQLLSRLFPFGRGLVHNYWAANVWALYSLVEKVMGMVGVSSLPSVPASVCAVLLLLSLLPGLYWGAWKAAVEHDNQRLVLAVVYSAMSSFQLGFHVHEKAILNAVIPMVFLICSTSSGIPETGGGSKDGSGQLHDKKRMAVLRVIFIQMTALGLLGIFPLLFRSVELPLKLVSYVAYMVLCYHVLLEQDETVLQSLGRRRIQIELYPFAAMCMGIIVVLEFVPMRLYGKLEFLPLLFTSVGCSVGLIVCWLRLSLWIMS
jgi:alpha-1,3-glucosyltransferase